MVTTAYAHLSLEYGPKISGTPTLIEDGSNMCQTSGPAGMSDGVMTPRKSIGNLVVLSAIGSGKSHETLREDSMSRSVQGSPTEKKEMREGRGKFGTVARNSQTDVHSFHAGRGSEGHLSWYAANCVFHFKPRTPSISSQW